MNADFSIEAGDFTTTEATVTLLTERGKRVGATLWGSGAVSVQVKKSRLPSLVAELVSRGLR